ncbi:hypothetical protein [Tsuneonella sp. HG222]
MRNTIHFSASATAAIAAALALSATPAFAQDASSAPLDGPIVNVPTTASPSVSQPAAQPTIVLPDVSTTSAPAPATTVTQPQTTTTTPAPRAATTTTTTPRTATTSNAAPAARETRTQAATPAPVRSTAATNIAAPAAATAAPVIASETVSEPATAFEPVAAAPVESEVAPTPEQTSDVTGILALALMGLVGAGLAGFALLAFRRKPKKAYRAAPAIERPIVREPVEPALAASPVITGSAVAAAPASAALYRQESAPAAVLDSNGAAVPLPSQMPESFEERDTLLKRMVAARPDRANPFTSYKARVHRARLILQSLGRKFENSRPWIDLSEYPRNWPALARSPRYQTA